MDLFLIWVSKFERLKAKLINWAEGPVYYWNLRLLLMGPLGLQLWIQSAKLTKIGNENIIRGKIKGKKYNIINQITKTACKAEFQS